MRLLVLAALGVVLAGCTAPPPAEPLPAPGEPLTRADGPPPNVSEAPSAPANRTFPRAEADVRYALYATTLAGDTGNMREATWQVDVPPGAAWVRATGNATGGPSLVVGELHLMVHVGTHDDPGPMIADASGIDDLATDLVPLPPGASTLLVMWHGTGAPASVSALQEAHLVVEFA